MDQLKQRALLTGFVLGALSRFRIIQDPRDPVFTWVLSGC